MLNKSTRRYEKQDGAWQEPKQGQLKLLWKCEKIEIRTPHHLTKHTPHNTMDIAPQNKLKQERQ
jgi:hypothetical protein